MAHHYDCVVDSGVLGFLSQSNLVVVKSELTKEVPQVGDKALCVLLLGLFITAFELSINVLKCLVTRNCSVKSVTCLVGD